jgi:cysteine sulfinate desulfinase/cysteine desulfurase-like protein
MAMKSLFDRPRWVWFSLLGIALLLAFIWVVTTSGPIAPIQFGAGQERGLRPGTQSVAQMVALGAAARLARERLPAALAEGPSGA